MLSNWNWKRDLVELELELFVSITMGTTVGVNAILKV